MIRRVAAILAVCGLVGACTPTLPLDGRTDAMCAATRDTRNDVGDRMLLVYDTARDYAHEISGFLSRHGALPSGEAEAYWADARIATERWVTLDREIGELTKEIALLTEKIRAVCSDR